MFKYVYIFVCIMLVPHLAIAQAPMVLPVDENPLIVETASEKVEYQVEIAQTNEEREKGLMYRYDLPSQRVMLFKFNEISPISMWMENTPLSLDMLFLNSEGIIVSIVENTTPFSRTIISSGVPSLYVIELNAGQIKQNHIMTGQRVMHPAIYKSIKE